MWPTSYVSWKVKTLTGLLAIVEHFQCMGNSQLPSKSVDKRFPCLEQDMASPMKEINLGFTGRHTWIRSGWWTAFGIAFLLSWSTDVSSGFIARRGIRWVSRFGLNPSLFTVLNHQKYENKKSAAYEQSTYIWCQNSGKKQHVKKKKKHVTWTAAAVLRKKEAPNISRRNFNF